MIDLASLAFTFALTALSPFTSTPRVAETFTDPMPPSQSAAQATLIPAVAATYDSVSQCVVTYDPLTNRTLSITLPDPSVPQYDYCVAYLRGETFNG